MVRSLTKNHTASDCCTITSKRKTILSGPSIWVRSPCSIRSSNMMRSVVLAIPFAFLLLGAVRADGEVKSAVPVDDTTRGGGYSQQYHYNSYPSHGGGGGHDPYGYTYAGLSFDLSTGLFLALGAIIVLLALAAVIYPLLSKNSGGWSGGDSYSNYGASSYGSYRSYNLAGTAEKVLSAVEKLYDAYNKSQ